MQRNAMQTRKGRNRPAIPFALVAQVVQLFSVSARRLDSAWCVGTGGAPAVGASQPDVALLLLLNHLWDIDTSHGVVIAAERSP